MPSKRLTIAHNDWLKYFSDKGKHTKMGVFQNRSIAQLNCILAVLIHYKMRTQSSLKCLKKAAENIKKPELCTKRCFKTGPCSSSDSSVSSLGER